MSYNGGIIKGSLRALNLSYNPLHALPPEGEFKANKKTFNDIEAESTLSDNDDDDDPFNSFSEIFVNFIKRGFCKKLTHVDLSGIEGINSKDLLEIL